MARPRAPTINIDTTNLSVDENAPEELTPNRTERFLSVPQPEDSAGVSSSDSGEFRQSSWTNYSMAQSRSSQSEAPSAEGTSKKPNKDPLPEAPADDKDSPFAFAKNQLINLVDPKNLDALRAMGGLNGLIIGLRTDLKTGLSNKEGKLSGKVTVDDCLGEKEPSSEASPSSGQPFESRKSFLGINKTKEKKPKNLFQLMWEAMKDKVLIMLSIAAVVSLAVGLYQTFGTPVEIGPDGQPIPKVEWIEGVAIMVAVMIVVLVGAANDYQKERQFAKLNRKKDDRKVKVFRDGKTEEINVHDLLVGDLALLEPGDVIPADGVYVTGHGVVCDESAATGESHQMKKTAGTEAVEILESGKPTNKVDPFILSGAKVLEGFGRFLVTGVGANSLYGKTLESLQTEVEATPLQYKLNRVAEMIAKLGGASALLLFVVLLIRFLAGLPNNHSTSFEKGQEFMSILIVSITLVVVAVPEGLPLAVTLALAFATVRMLKDNNLVRVLASCETMGNATTVCSDKTGTLTQNKMTVIKGTISTACRFSENDDTTKKEDTTQEVSEATSITEFANIIANDTKQLLVDSIALNSTAFEGEGGEHGFVGSKTETALLGFARKYLDMGKLDEARNAAEIVQFIPFDSSRKCMGVVVKHADVYRLYVKGASEIVLSKCKRFITEPQNPGLGTALLSDTNISDLNKVIESYAEKSLRTIGLVYREFQQWPPKATKTLSDDPKAAKFEDIFRQMTFIGVVGIQDPLRDGVPKAVKDFQKAGVFVRMVTGDNVITARAIATECGIYTPGGIIIEGPKFRKMSRMQMKQVIPRLQVLARSSPEDKRILTNRLKELGETVAVTGDGTNDAPSLKAADVGFSMGIAGTEVAKEASAIILMDDNFSSIVKAMMWGRTVNDAVRKFLQFQLTVNITAVLLTFISAVASASQTSVLTAVQLLWVNLIMDTFAALALASDPPPASILDRKPDSKSAALITVDMWKMIFGEAIFQIVVTLILNFAGPEIMQYTTPDEIVQLRTLVFNTFVWMQIFNMVNCRRLDTKLNIFEGVYRNFYFMGIALIIIGGQVLIIFVGGAAFSVQPLYGQGWAISIILGALSLPIGVVVRLIPNELVTRLVPNWVADRAHKQRMADEERLEWNNPALEQVGEDLLFLKRFRGGRLNQLKFKPKDMRDAMRIFRSPSPNPSEEPQSISAQGQGSASEKHRSSSGPYPPPSPSSEGREAREGSESQRRSRSNSALSAAIMSASIYAGSVGGGFYSPNTANGSSGLPFADRDGLEAAEGIELHPRTPLDDPVIETPEQLSAHASQVGLAPGSHHRRSRGSSQSSHQSRSPSPRAPSS